MAEGLGSKNYNWDKSDGYWVPDDEVLYNSYIYEAHDDTSVLEKFRMQGDRYTKLLDGGVGLHCNLDDHLDKEQYLKLIDYAIKEGTSYFTFNIPNCQCDDCNYIAKHHFDTCPICGSTHTTDWTRIIGYLRPVSKFDKYRKAEAAKRTYSKTVEDA